ncbi:DUF885 domain-containing protein [Parablastomonas sp. CN1-191]|uniref:DUF885 domain-containing protein n=1 Tax=Parablastomonas sp. CN1-191 TaxID=3400908 RepID=UPI003BF9173D
MRRLPTVLLPVLMVAALPGCATNAPHDTAIHAAQAQAAITATGQAIDAANQLAFGELGRRYLASLVRFQPVSATQLGDHRYDSALPDLSPAGRAAETAEWRSILAALTQVDRNALRREDQVDYALLGNQLRYDIWTSETLQPWATDPLLYGGTATGSLESLTSRDFAPWPDRLRSATSRMEAIPGLLAAARAQLVPARVAPIYATTAVQRIKGLTDPIADMRPHLATLSAAERARFEAAASALAAAQAAHLKWLETTLVPQAKGDFRLGPALYDQKMKFALQSDLSRAELKARAQAEFAAVRKEMAALSRQALAEAKIPAPADEQALIERALQLTYARRPARTELMADARAALAQATAFVRQKRFVTVPDTPIRVIEMPRSMWGYAVAYDDAPGALEKDQPNFFAVAPIPPEWTDAQATSFLSEYNDYMVQDLAIHEAMPGHYLQLAHANQFDDPLRSVLQSGPFVEGWAVMAEAQMAEQGYMGGDPLYKLTMLKMRLRSVTNTLLDIGIQTEGMTRDQAMELMMKGAFQQEREAAGKWVRASLGSVQLLSYFIGYTEHAALRAEAMRRDGAAFDQRRFNDALLAHGSPPVKYARQLVLGLPIE